jgi:hypothetical protein
MSDLSDFTSGGGDIKAGDNLRIEEITFAASQTNADITILSRSGKGFIDSAIFGNTANGATLKINSIKVTVDGAAERTISLGNFFDDIFNPTGDKSNSRRDLSCPIKYNTSITFKANYTTGVTGTNARVLLTHSIG